MSRCQSVALLFRAVAWISLALTPAAEANESLWLEAEHFDGIRGYCWPMGPPAGKKTAGHWGLSGPGWAAEWCQGGESGFLSIAAGADDDRAVATKAVEIPIAGQYALWVRYGDWREQSERFEVEIEQTGGKTVVPVRGAGGRRGRQRDEALFRLGVRLGQPAGLARQRTGDPAAANEQAETGSRDSSTWWRSRPT